MGPSARQPTDEYKFGVQNASLADSRPPAAPVQDYRTSAARRVSKLHPDESAASRLQERAEADLRAIQSITSQVQSSVNDAFREIDSRFEREFHEKLQLRASDSRRSVQQGQQLVRGSALRRSFQSSEAENFDSPEPVRGVSVSV